MIRTISITLIILLCLTSCGRLDTEQSEAIPPLRDGELIASATSTDSSELGEYTTKIVDQTADRVHNIDKTIEALNGLVIKPGEEFSFNHTVGNRTAERGYKEARALKGKEKIMEIGGGVCQVSSTIYQAALMAGFTITEHHPHQKKVDYIDEGKDATVDYGTFDLKFRNNRSYPVTLSVSRDKEQQYLNVTFER